MMDLFLIIFISEELYHENVSKLSKGNFFPIIDSDDNEAGAARQHTVNEFILRKLLRLWKMSFFHQRIITQIEQGYTFCHKL